MEVFSGTLSMEFDGEVENFNINDTDIPIGNFSANFLDIISHLP